MLDPGPPLWLSTLRALQAATPDRDGPGKGFPKKRIVPSRDVLFGIFWNTLSGPPNQDDLEARTVHATSLTKR